MVRRVPLTSDLSPAGQPKLGVGHDGDYGGEHVGAGGGPNNATLTSFFYIYDTGFARFDFGLAAAGTYVLSGIVAAMSYAQIRLARWGEV